MTSHPLTCPVCMTHWGPSLRTREGQACGDLSQGQGVACPGRLVRFDKLDRAEWTWLVWWRTSRLRCPPVGNLLKKPDPLAHDIEKSYVQSRGARNVAEGVLS